MGGQGRVVGVTLVGDPLVLGSLVLSHSFQVLRKRGLPPITATCQQARGGTDHSAAPSPSASFSPHNYVITH